MADSAIFFHGELRADSFDDQAVGLWVFEASASSLGAGVNTKENKTGAQAHAERTGLFRKICARSFSYDKAGVFRLLFKNESLAW